MARLLKITAVITAAKAAKIAIKPTAQIPLNGFPSEKTKNAKTIAIAATTKDLFTIAACLFFTFMFFGISIKLNWFVFTVSSIFSFKSALF